MIRTITPGTIPTKDLHQFLLGSVAPRPIAFASTIDENGVANIAPYSFFNCFSSNPPILVFSSNRRVSNNTTKDTLANVMANKEVVINVVNFDIVRQMTIASVEFPAEVSEFDKSGLTPLESEKVAPFRIAESPVQMECTVSEVIPLGDQGGAGHLIICKVALLHIKENVIDENNRIDPQRIDLMGRMGRAYYVRASGAAVFPIVQSVLEMVIGFDGLPDHIKSSNILTGSNLAQLAGLTVWPSKEEGKKYLEENPALKARFYACRDELAIHMIAKEFLDQGDQRQEAANILAIDRI